VLTLLVLLAIAPTQPMYERAEVGNLPPARQIQLGRVASERELLASSDLLWASGNDWALVDRFNRLREDHLRMLRQAF
jgi:hypothetical protein